MYDQKTVGRRQVKIVRDLLQITFDILSHYILTALKVEQNILNLLRVASPISTVGKLL